MSVFFCSINLSLLVLSASIQCSDPVIWCVASGPNTQRKSRCLLFSFVFHCAPVILSFSMINPISTLFSLCVLLEPLRPLSVSDLSILFASRQGIWILSSVVSL